MNGELERQAKEKAREYFRTKATPLPVSEVRARIAEPLRACDELVTPLSAALWTTGSGTQVLTTCVTGLPRLLLGS